MSKRWIVLGFGGVAIILSFTGIALPHWATYYHGNVGTTHFGLWRKCNAKDGCTQYPDDCKKYNYDFFCHIVSSCIIYTKHVIALERMIRVKHILHFNNVLLRITLKYLSFYI